MRSTLALAFLGGAVAEKTWLNRFSSFPGTKTLEVVHFVTVEEGTKPEMVLLGPVRVDNPDNLNLGAGLQISVIPHARLSELTENSQFCCTSDMLAAKKCSEENGLSIPGSFSWTINKENLEKGFSGIQFLPPSTGLYYVALSNCGPSTATVKFESGELSLVTTAGYLPAEEQQKLAFYFWLFVGYMGLLVVWGVWCSAWPDVLFKIHHYITATICVGLVEAICWYASLYHWNYLGHRWWSMIALASFGTVCKQGVSYGLLLLACLGLGVTKPRLESKQIVQCVLLVAAFIVSDGIRQMALMMQDRVNGITSTWKVILLVTPGSVFVSILYVWILQGLQDTIKSLNDTKQTVKAEVYQHLRLALGLVMGVVVSLVAYETIIVRRTELAVNWQSRWIFTDVLSHCCFFFLLGVIMYLWKPSERSVQMAFSQQLDSTEGVEMGKNAENFESVDVELGDDPAETGDYDFQKDMEAAKKKAVPDVLE